MHFVYIACLLEMQGRNDVTGHDVTGQGREENGKYNADSLNEI